MYTPYRYQQDGGEYRIGPYPSRDSCQSVNNSAFGGSGRCDCTEIADPSEGYAPAAGVSGYSRGNAQEAAAVAQQQEYEAANLQRMRQQEEEIRQRQIEEKAKRDAEVRRRELEWKQKKAELMTSLKGSASGDFKLKGGGEEIDLKPKGKDFFETWKNQGQLGDMKLKGTVMGHEDASKQAPPSSESENRRRALWLYQRAAKAKDSEEANFLSQQADEAAQGHPLSVEVPPAQETPEISRADLQQFEKMAEVVEKDHVKMDTLQQKKVYAEEKKTQLQKQLSDVKEKIQKAQEEPQVKEAPEPEKAPEAKEEPKVEEAAKIEKPKGGEDLLAELQALEKEMKETDKEVTRLAKEEEKAKETFERSQSNLDKSVGKK